MCQLAVNFRAIHFMSRQKRCYSAVVYLQFIEEIFFKYLNANILNIIHNNIHITCNYNTLKIEYSI